MPSTAHHSTLLGLDIPSLSNDTSPPRKFPVSMSEHEVRHETSVLKFKQRCIRACLADMASEHDVHYSAMVPPTSPMRISRPNTMPAYDSIIFADGERVVSDPSVWFDTTVLRGVIERERGRTFTSPPCTVEPLTMRGPMSRAVNPTAVPAVAVSTQSEFIPKMPLRTPNPFESVEYRSSSIGDYTYPQKQVIPIARAVAETLQINSSLYTHLNRSPKHTFTPASQLSLKLTSPFQQRQYIPPQSSYYPSPAPSQQRGDGDVMKTITTCSNCVFGEPVQYFST